MRIERIEEKTGLLLTLHGRLDAAHCRNLEDELEDALRQGAHRVTLDMEDVLFLSSAGLRTLLRYQKTLSGLGGALVLSRTSSFVREILGMVGMTSLFEAPTGHARGEEPWSSHLGEGAARYELAASRGFRVDLPTPGEVRSFEPGVWGLGVGAFDDTVAFPGEILAAEGYALMQPPGEGEAPDFMTAAGSFVPTVHFASGSVLRGGPSHCLRFAEGLPGIPLARLARGALEVVGGRGAALVLVAETSGLVGARLGRLDATTDPEAGGWRDVALRMAGERFFSFPAVRDHLAYRPEKRYDRHLALVVGVVTAVPSGPLASQVRPLGDGGDLWGHFHGAVFPFKAIPQGKVDLPLVLEKLFDAGAPVGLLHLLHDRRPISGAGESAFLSGALWVGALQGPEGGRA